MQTTNLTLPELVTVLEAQNSQKADYVVESRLIKMENGMLIVPETNGGMYKPNEIMHQHLAEKLGIPANYYKKMMEQTPELLEANVNRWFQETNKPMMVRSFESGEGNIARAYLSDRYRITDNYDVLFKALQAIKESGVEVKIQQADITDKKMYVYITAPNVEVQAEEMLKHYLRDSEVGYGIVAGLVLSNSEVGYGSYEIRMRAMIKRCMNGLISPDDSFRRVHLGAKLEQGQVKWSKETEQKNLELIMSQTGDAVKQFLNEGYLSGVVQNLKKAHETKLDKPVDAVQNAVRHVAKTVSMTEENKSNILNFFVQDGDTHGSGIVHAMTREAQSMPADSRYEMEAAAFEVIGSVKSFDVPFVSGKN